VSLFRLHFSYSVVGTSVLCLILNAISSILGSVNVLYNFYFQFAVTVFISAFHQMLILHRPRRKCAVGCGATALVHWHGHGNSWRCFMVCALRIQRLALSTTSKLEEAYTCKRCRLWYVDGSFFVYISHDDCIILSDEFKSCFVSLAVNFNIFISVGLLCDICYVPKLA
jgi:hypothetical protein